MTVGAVRVRRIPSAAVARRGEPAPNRRPPPLCSVGWARTRCCASTTSGRITPSSAIAAGSGSLPRRQVLEDEGILGRNEVTKCHHIEGKFPEERENPVVVDLGPAWQANLLNFPAAGLADRVADLPDQSLLGVVFEVRWDGERTDRAHRHVLDPAILAHSFVRPFSDQDTRIRNRPSLVNLLVQLLEDLLLGAVIHACRNVDVCDGHLFLPLGYSASHW